MAKKDGAEKLLPVDMRTVAAVGALLVGASGIFFGWVQYQGNTPGLRVNLVGVDVRVESISKSEIANKLDTIESNFPQYTGSQIVDLIRSLEEKSPESVASDLEDARTAITAQVGRRWDAMDSLLEEIGDLSSSQSDLAVLRAELAGIERRFSEYTRFYITNVIEAIDAGDTQVAPLLEFAVTRIRQDRETLTQNGLNSLNQAIEDLEKEIAAGKGERVQVSLILENYRQLPALIRRHAALGLTQASAKRERPLDISVGQEVRLEPFSATRVVFESRMLTQVDEDQGDFVKDYIGTASCVVLVEDIHGNRWQSTLAKCDEGTINRRDVVDALEQHMTAQ